MTVSVIAVVAFFVVMISIGVFSRRLVSSSKDFLLAGREMSLGVNSMGILASGFAGTTLALNPSFVLMFGMVGALLIALGICIVGYLFYGLVFARAIRRSGAYTIMEWLGMRFNVKTRRILTITGFIGIVAITANNCLAMANVLTGYFNLSIYVTVPVAVVTFLIFTFLSGMWGVSLTDFVQALIGCVGIPILFIGAYTHFGGPMQQAELWQGIAGAGLFGHGINGAVVPGLSIIYPSALTILLNIGVFLCWGGQHYWIRAASARSEKDAKNSMLIGCVLCFVVQMSIGYMGAIAGANFPEKFTLMGGDTAPGAAYGLVSANFGVGMGSFLIVFALAASLSTAATTLMGSVTIATKDIYPYLINKNPSEQQIKRAGKVAVILISVAVWLIAYYPGGVTFLTAFATAWMAPAGLIFAVGFFWKRATPTAAFTGAVLALILESVYIVFDLFKIPIGGQLVGTYIHLSVVGTLACLIPTIIVTFFSKPKYFGASTWALQQNAAAQPAAKEITLSEEDKEFLSLILKGYTTMAELIDMTGQAGEKVSGSIEKLDEGRYVTRDALSGRGFWSFHITEKGKSALPQLSEADAALEPLGLTANDITVLRFVKSSGKSRSSNLVYDNYSDPDEARMVAAAIVKLLRNGYLNESGFMKRWIEISDKGEGLLSQYA